MKKQLLKFSFIRTVQMFLSFCFILFMMNTNIVAETVTYTPLSRNSVTTSGTAPTGSSASFYNTYNNKNQVTKNNSMTFTLSGYAGCKITGITLSMKSNTDKGSGYFSMVAGSTTLSSIATATAPAAFNSSSWHGAWSTSYVDVTPAMTNSNYTIGTGEDVVVTIAATVSSLYCQYITITYEPTPKYDITFNPGTGTCTPSSANVNVIDLSTVTATPSVSCQASGWVFVGWSESEVAETNSEPTMVSGTYMPSGDITLYAVYKFDGGAINTASRTFLSYGFDNGRTMQNDEPHAINSVATISFNQGGNIHAGVPAYYTDGEAVRCYVGNTFKVKSTVLPIRSITLTFSTGGGSNTTVSGHPISASTGTYTDGENEGSWTGSADSVTFTVSNSLGNTSGHRRLAAITVTYGQNFAVVYNTNPNCVRTLNIAYMKADGTQAAGDYSQSVGINLPYNVTSPQVSGYVADRSVVAGTMPNDDVYDTVTYHLVTVDIDSIFHCDLPGSGSITVTNPTSGYEYSLDGTSFQSSPAFTDLNAGDHTLYIRPVGQDYNYTGVWTVSSNINAPSNPNYVFTVNGPDAYGSLAPSATSTTVSLTNPTVTHFMDNFINHYSTDSVTLVNDAPAEYTATGDYTVEWTATDKCGNIATTTVTVHITEQTCAGVSDVDGNNYQTVLIGSKCWMAENLRTTRYSDGRNITNIYLYTNSYRPDANANKQVFGLLYDWYDALDSNSVRTRSPYVQGICPADWHIPTESEFQELSAVDLHTLRSSEYWLKNPGSNTTGFTMHPAGMYSSDASRYEDLLDNAYFWSSAGVDDITAHCYMADCHCYMIFDLIRKKNDAYSIRCVKNE